MDASQLTAELKRWKNEFEPIAKEKVQAPESFWKFLAQRLSEIGVVEEDPDVVRADIYDGYRRVKITGTFHGGLLAYEMADGAYGNGYVPRDKIHREDLGKLSSILDRLLQEGRVREA